jgi:hypothetical protein
MKDLSYQTIIQPVFKIDGVIYLPVYTRPTSMKWWIGPDRNTYTSQRLVAEGAVLDMMELWERFWLIGMVKMEKNATIGETKRAYLRLFGVI